MIQKLQSDLSLVEQLAIITKIRQDLSGNEELPDTQQIYAFTSLLGVVQFILE